jgi:hypothetical protein
LRHIRQEEIRSRLKRGLAKAGGQRRHQNRLFDDADQLWHIACGQSGGQMHKGKDRAADLFGKGGVGFL